jgi:hypothetical protein
MYYSYAYLLLQKLKIKVEKVVLHQTTKANNENRTYDVMGFLAEVLSVGRRASFLFVFRSERFRRERESTQLAAHQGMLHQEDFKNVACRAGQQR